MGCPPANSGPPVFNMTQDCVTLLRELHNAYNRVMSGNQRVTVRFGERWTEYQKSNVGDLLAYYQTMYSQCPGAQAAGLPNLNPGLQARRGPPVRGLSVFGRL